MLKLIIPLVSAQVAQSLTGFCDTLMMGRLGTSTLAAGGLASMTLMTLLGIAGGVIMAVSPLVAAAYGAGKKTRIEQLTRQGFWLILLLTLPITVAVDSIDNILLRQGQDPFIVALAHDYLSIMIWSCFPALGFMLLRGVISGLSHTRPIMFIVVAGTIFNVIGNYIFAFGKLGFPRLEIRGLAIASLITFWGMFLALAVYMIRHPQIRTYRLFSFNSLKLPVLKELLKLGIPIGIFIALESGLFAVVTYLMGTLGTDTLAAHQIVLQTVIILFMIPLGISYGATIRVGQWLGRNNIIGIKQAGTASVVVGLIFSIVTAIAILCFPQLIIGFYLDLNDPGNLEVINLATPLLTIGVVALVLDGVQKIVYGILQGLQDTRVPVFLSIPAFWVVGLGVGYILSFYYDWGGVGLWLGQSLGLAIAAVIFLVRLAVVINKIEKA